MIELPRMYQDLAAWWPLLSPPEDYAEEAAAYLALLEGAVTGPLHTCLELGSGGGSNASWLKARLALTLVDPSEGMLAHSRALNPGCEHLVGDMRTFRLGRTFDAVFIHDAIDYMTTRDDLAAAVATAFAHTRPGGAALFCPDHVAERFAPSTDHGGTDGPDGRGVRFLEWTTDADPDDERCSTDYVYALRSSDGSVRVEHERHEHGLFARQVWLDTLARAGFEASGAIIEHSQLEPDTYEVFVGRRVS